MPQRVDRETSVCLGQVLAMSWLDWIDQLKKKTRESCARDCVYGGRNVRKNDQADSERIAVRIAVRIAEPHSIASRAGCEGCGGTWAVADEPFALDVVV